MAKKRNIEVKKLRTHIEALEYDLAQHKQCIDVTLRTINDMLAHTHNEIASLQWVNDAQYTEAMIQLTAIKRTLSVLQLMAQTAKDSWLKKQEAV